eukprot:TRINITY_DN4655_c0_g3_i2.p2 TRINITY_DN4655_c0_g3~~TRINITY_DN4655_c0_g3_i2.p2  ORF type:complete len:146 (-),score=25.14 TRINITY_DN4655_c0_g3_i2:976-1413(-)
MSAIRADSVYLEIVVELEGDDGRWGIVMALGISTSTIDVLYLLKIFTLLTVRLRLDRSTSTGTIDKIVVMFLILGGTPDDDDEVMVVASKDDDDDVVVNSAVADDDEDKDVSREEDVASLALVVVADVLVVLSEAVAVAVAVDDA